MPTTFLRNNISTQPFSCTLSWYSRGRIERQHPCSQAWLYIIFSCQGNWDFMSFPNWPVEDVRFLFTCLKMMTIKKSVIFLFVYSYYFYQVVVSIYVSGNQLWRGLNEQFMKPINRCKTAKFWKRKIRSEQTEAEFIYSRFWSRGAEVCPCISSVWDRYSCCGWLTCLLIKARASPFGLLL